MWYLQAVKAAVALALVFAVGCASEAVVPKPEVPDAQSAAPEPQVPNPPAPPPVLAEPRAESDLELASAMSAGLREHHEATERKRTEDRLKYEEMVSRPSGLLDLGSSANRPWDSDLGGLGGNGAVGRGGGAAVGGGSLSGLGTGKAAKPVTKKPAKPKTPNKK